MTAVLVVAADESRRTRLQRALGGHSVFVAATDAEAIRLARYVDVDVVVRDAPDSPRGVRELAMAIREATPTGLLIVVGSTEEDVPVEATMPADFTTRDVDTALARALEKQRLVREVSVLRARVGSPAAEEAHSAEVTWDGIALSRALKELARAFAAGFDLPRVLEIFLDTAAELVRPSRAALLLPDEHAASFHIVAHRNLPGPLVASMHLPAESGLARWLRREARPARLHDLDLEIARELSLMHAVVAVPLMAHGDLVGVLALGQPVVRIGYTPHEIETLFDLATQLAMTVRDIALHHQLAHEKEFSERILAHMSSGVITIGREHRIGTMNRRAEAILGLDAGEIVGQDLRRLPSPLGDMLYETLTTGHTMPRSEIQLALGGRWLEVSTYPVHGDEPVPLGAVLVFEDLTAQKELLAQKRQAEQRDLLTRVVARIADEIKNPLVSINTFVELIDERVDDPDFRKDFSVIVRRDVRRLVQVFEKLAGLVSDGELHCSTVDARHVVDDLVASIQGSDDSPGHPVQLEVSRDEAPHLVRTDAAQLRRALSYLVWFLTHASDTEPARVSISVGRVTETDGKDRVRFLVASRTATARPETLMRLFDPVQMVQENLIAVGPAVSQRIVEALGGQLRLRQGRHELAFLVTLPASG
jgi:two-component system, NtrC family, sensor histidine kinase AtoS